MRGEDNIGIVRPDGWAYMGNLGLIFNELFQMKLLEG